MSLNPLSFLCPVAAVVCLSGCAGNDPLGSVKLHPPNSFSNLKSVATHSKNEVLTRQWQDSFGAMMTLLDFQIEQVEGRPMVAIAKYGEKLTGHVHCVDFYECRLTSDPTDAALFLLCHDNRKGWVTDIRIERKDDQVFVNFVRQISDPDTLKIIRNSYSYRYDKDSGFSRTTGDFYQDLSPR